MNLRTNLIVGLYLFLLTASMPVFAQANMKESDELDFAQGLLSRGMYDMAISQYQKFIAEFPHSSSLQEAYLLLGEGYFLSQDFDHAVNTFDQFKQLFPNSDQLPIGLLRLAQIDIQQNKFDDALKELTSIDVQKQLKGAMLQSFDFYMAQAYIGKSDQKSALDYYQKATQVEGAFDYTPYAYDEIGKIDAQNSHFSDALDAYAKAMASTQEDSLKGELFYRIAETQFLSGKYPDAIKGFQQLITQYPASDFARDALANELLAYFNLAQYDQLLAEYQKNAPSVKNDDAFFNIDFAAVLAYIELKQFDQANTLLDHMLALTALKPQEKTQISIKKADILIRQKNYKDGLSLLDAISSTDTNNDEVLFLRGQANFGLGEFDHAFSSFENVYQNYPNSKFLKAALLGEAHSRQEAGRFKESEVLFRKYYDLQDDPALKSDSLFDAVMMALKANDIDGTINNAQEYLKAFPSGEKYSEVLFILADNDAKNNKYQDAINLLQGYLSKTQAVQRPNTANFLLGYNLQLLGNNDQALAAYALVDQQKEDGKYYTAALKNMAIIYLNEKKEDQAKIYFDRLISSADQNELQLKTYIWVCNQYLKDQKFDDVLRVATLAEKNFPPADLLEIEYFKAEAERGKGNCDDAIKSYGLVIDSRQKNAFTGGAHIGNGLCLESAKKFDESKAEFQKALDDNADDFTVTVHARFELANLLASQGDLENALKFYVLIATIYDDDYFCSESLLRAAKICVNLNKKDDAIKMYAEILDKYKNTKAAIDAKTGLAALKTN